MGYENLLFDIRNQVATVTINRPAKRNALNGKTVEEIFMPSRQFRRTLGCEPPS